MPTLIERLRALTTPGGRKVADPLQAITARIEATDAAIAQARAEEQAETRLLASAAEKRDALLLEGADRAQLLAHDARVDEIRDVLRALELFIRQQERRRAELLAQRVEAATSIFRARWHKAATAFAATLQATHAECTALLAIVSEARTAGMEPRWIEYFPPPPWQYRDDALFSKWAQAVAARAPGARSAPPPPRQIAAPAAPPAPKPAPTAPPAPSVRSPRVLPGPLPGTEAVVVLRSGYEANGFQFLAGETAHVAPHIAEAAAKNGAVNRATRDVGATP